LNRNEEYVVLVDENDQAIGMEQKKAVHTDKTPLHRGFSLFLFNADNELLLQQRAGGKKTWPLVWSNSCCGHPFPDESYENAVIRRTQFELGIRLEKVVKISDYQYCFSKKGVMENEICPIFIGFYDGDVIFNPEEVEAIKWIQWQLWLEETDQNPARYSPWCVEETRIIAAHLNFKEMRGLF